MRQASYRVSPEKQKEASLITGTRITISDKYALSGNGNLVEKNKRET
jgi:hypothetical protein